jgi:hypothetical protein
MAIRKSIRPARQSDRAGTNCPRVSTPDRVRSGDVSRAPLRVVLTEHASDVVRGLVMAALRLKVIYGTALAVELALRKQDAEQDVDIAECLRSGVCNPISEQADIIRTLVERFGAHLPEPLP